MKSHHIKYLSCFCGSETLYAYGFENGNFKLMENGADKAIKTGLLVCGGCRRAYPINDRIVYMLPEALPDASAEKFFKTHSKSLPKDIRIPNFGKSQDSSDEDKKNEMLARDEQAHKYHTYLMKTYASNEQRIFKRFLGPLADDVIVELGCGTGKITNEIIKAGFKDFIAFDFSEASIRITLDQLDKNAKDSVLFIKGDVCNLPLKDQIADKCVSAQVFEHIPGVLEQGKFISSLKRIMKPGGTAALTIYNLNIRKRFQKAEKGYHEGSIYFENFTKSKLKKSFEAQFKIKEMYGINCYFPFFYKAPEGLQRTMESFLSWSPLNSLLGNILFLGLRL